MSHRVVRRINGRLYEYEEESYRVPGLKNPRKRSRYIGPVLEAIREALKTRRDIGETPEEESARLAREDAERAQQDRVNEVLTGATISLEGLAEVAEKQGDKSKEGTASAPSEGSDSSDGSSASQGDDV